MFPIWGTWKLNQAVSKYAEKQDVKLQKIPECGILGRFQSVGVEVRLNRFLEAVLGG